MKEDNRCVERVDTLRLRIFVSDIAIRIQCSR